MYLHLFRVDFPDAFLYNLRKAWIFEKQCIESPATMEFRQINALKTQEIAEF